MSKKIVNSNKAPIEELGFALGYPRIFIEGIKREEGFSQGYLITPNELEKLKKKHYGGI